MEDATKLVGAVDPDTYRVEVEVKKRSLEVCDEKEGGWRGACRCRGLLGTGTGEKARLLLEAKEDACSGAGDALADDIDVT